MRLRIDVDVDLRLAGDLPDLALRLFAALALRNALALASGLKKPNPQSKSPPTNAIGKKPEFI
jgi:hypothetical protein